MSQFPVGESAPEAKYPLLADALRTHDGFVASVNVRGGFNPFQFVPIAAGAILLVRTYYMSRPVPWLDRAPTPWWKAMFWSGPYGSGPDVAMIVMSWLASAMIIGGVVWLLHRRLTLPRDTERLYQQYLQDGFLVGLTPTNIAVMHGRTLMPMFLFGLPTTSYEAIMAALETLRANIKQSRLYVFKLSQLTSGGRQRGRALKLADATLPSDVFAASVVGFPPYDRPRIGVSDGDTVRLYTLKREVSVM